MKSQIIYNKLKELTDAIIYVKDSSDVIDIVIMSAKLSNILSEVFDEGAKDESEKIDKLIKSN